MCIYVGIHVFVYVYTGLIVINQFRNVCEIRSLDEIW